MMDGIFEQFPYSNLHNLNLDWILKVLKEYGKVIDGLDKIIEDAIKQGLQDLDIMKLILDAMSEYGLVINVKAPPNGLDSASGDGSKDDTATIQGCIDYASSKGGGAVFFPSGKYLTQSLVLKSNVSLVAFDNSTSEIVLKGGATTSMLTGDVENCIISNITFNGNMDIQVNNIDIIDLKAKDLNISNVRLKDGYNLMKIVANGCVRVNSIDFGNAVIDALYVTGSGQVTFNDIMFHNLSVLNGRYIINNSVNNAVYNNIYSTATTDIAINNTSDKSVFVGKILNAVTVMNDTGTNTYSNFYERGGSSDSRLTQEIQDRINADTLLRTDLDAEILARTNADALLRTDIDNNETASILQDGILQDNIDAETQARISADSLLRTDLDAEIQNRTQAVTGLDNKLTLEIQNRTQADTTINTRIDDEIQDRIDGDELLQDEIDILKFGSMYANVRQFGAVGNGIADDTQAFQDAINTKKKVYVPKGRYLIKNTLMLYEQSSIMGDFVGANNYSRGVTLIDFQPVDNTKDLFFMSDDAFDSYYVYGLEIGHITITGTKGRYIFNLPNMSNLYLHDISYQGGFDRTMRIHEWIDCIVERCSFQGVVEHHLDFDLEVDHYLSTTVSFNRCYFSYAKYCYYVKQDAINSLVFNDCIFESMDYIGESETGNNITFNNLYFENIPRNGTGSVFKVGLVGEQNVVPNKFVISGGFAQGNSNIYTNTSLIESGYIASINISNLMLEWFNSIVKHNNFTKRVELVGVATLGVQYVRSGVGDIFTLSGCEMPYTTFDITRSLVYIGKTDISPVRTTNTNPNGALYPVYLGQIIKDELSNKLYIANGLGNNDWVTVSYTPPTPTPPREINGSPIGAIVPNSLGEEVLDTSTSNWYKGTGYTNSDWKLITYNP